MTTYKDWFGVDIKKRAARVRIFGLGHIIKELLANSLDARATDITIACTTVGQMRRNRSGMKAYNISCIDNGDGCRDPEILRRVGSSISDLSPETRGRFGQGLIDVIAISERSEICTLNNRLLFDKNGCNITTARKHVKGMVVTALLRHSGEGFEGLESYFDSVILPEGIRLKFNDRRITPRNPKQIIPRVRLQTVIYDSKKEQYRRFQRDTSVEIYPQFGETPMVYELGIPVEDFPWTLPYDINVMQKTPLNAERNLLPSKYKDALISKLIEPMSDKYITYMKEHNEAPSEIRDHSDNATCLTEKAQRLLVKMITGADKDKIVRRNPLDPNDTSESHELEDRGYVPLNRGNLASGVSKLLENNYTVADVHDKKCKPHFRPDPEFPALTDRQRQCMMVYSEIVGVLLNRCIKCDRVRGGFVAAAMAKTVLKLNIDVKYLWDDPLVEQALAVIIHESAHGKVSGHSVAFTKEVERMGAKLTRWVGENQIRWAEFNRILYET